MGKGEGERILNFWDYIFVAGVLAIRDGYRDMEKQAARQAHHQAQFYQKCKEEISDAFSDLHDTIVDVSRRANPNYFPPDILDGSVMLPVYAFMKVLKAQGGSPSIEQSTMIDLFFKNMSVGFSKHEFLASLHNNNNARQKMKALLGISESFVGTFWIAFFKAMYVTKSDEATLSKVMDHFSAIVMRFSVLGNLREQSVVSICEKFATSIQKQIVVCRGLPESTIDLIGEAHYFEHMKRMADIAFSLHASASEPDDPEIETWFPMYLTNLLYELLDRSSLNPGEKARVLDRSMKLCSVQLKIGDLQFSGYDVYDQMKNNGLIYPVVSVATNAMFTMILTFVHKTKRYGDSSKFISESVGFLAGLEKEFAAEFPFCGFSRIALEYIIEEMNKIEFNV